ncbi:MAG TPA: hypothetical protein VIV11_23045 [Kofleriaceae bacterium]
MPIRIDPIVTATYLVTLSAPLLVYRSFRLARAREHGRHRLVQTTLVIVCWLAVLALELRIRFGGGSGVFVDAAAPDLARWARRLLAIHIPIAVVTYAVWTWLVVTSRRRYASELPGRFSRRHRQLGLAVFGGLCFTAASATGMYVLAFVA